MTGIPWTPDPSESRNRFPQYELATPMRPDLTELLVAVPLVPVAMGPARRNRLVQVLGLARELAAG